MNAFKKMCLCGTVIILCLILSSYHSSGNYFKHLDAVSIEDALKYQLISIEATNLGSYSGECILMNLTNTTSRPLTVLIEAGRNFASEDTNKQDIVIIKETLFSLQPFGSQVKKLFGFCSQSHKGAPDENDQYTLGNMMPKEVVQLATHLNKNKYPVDAMQHAVWTLTNNRPISSVFHTDRDSIKGLQEFLAQYKNEIVPWYSLEYMPNDSTGMVSNKVKTIYGTLKADLEKGRVIKVVIYDLYNISQIRKDIKVPEKTKEQPIMVDVSELPKGRYRILFTSLAGEIDEKIFWI